MVWYLKEFESYTWNYNVVIGQKYEHSLMSHSVEITKISVQPIYIPNCAKCLEVISNF